MSGIYGCFHVVCFSVVDEYEAICEKALGTPTSTEQLFQLKEEIEKIKEKTIPVLEHDVFQYLKKYMFLSDFTQISPILSKLETQSIQWCKRMPSVFDEYAVIVAKKTLEFQEALKVRNKIKIILLVQFNLEEFMFIVLCLILFAA